MNYSNTPSSIINYLNATFNAYVNIYQQGYDTQILVLMTIGIGL